MVAEAVQARAHLIAAGVLLHTVLLHTEILIPVMAEVFREAGQKILLQAAGTTAGTVQAVQEAGTAAGAGQAIVAQGKLPMKSDNCKNNGLYLAMGPHK